MKWMADNGSTDLVFCLKKCGLTLLTFSSTLNNMHPPLAAHKHQGCLEAIQALEECHQAGLFNRFSGACNDTKQKLDQCLKEEVSILVPARSSPL